MRLWGRATRRAWIRHKPGRPDSPPFGQSGRAVSGNSRGGQPVGLGLRAVTSPQFLPTFLYVRKAQTPIKRIQNELDAAKRPAEAGRFPLAHPIQLALFAYVVSPVRLAGWIKRFPPGLLPSRTAVLKINSGPVQYGVEAWPGRRPAPLLKQASRHDEPLQRTAVRLPLKCLPA